VIYSCFSILCDDLFIYVDAFTYVFVKLEVCIRISVIRMAKYNKT